MDRAPEESRVVTRLSSLHHPHVETRFDHSLKIQHENSPHRETDARVDHRHERRRDLHKVNAALVDSRRETHDVADHL